MRTKWPKRMRKMTTTTSWTKMRLQADPSVTLMPHDSVDAELIPPSDANDTLGKEESGSVERS